MPLSFSLVEEGWIPCRLSDGTLRELGIRETLSRAHEIREVTDPSPLVTSALLRFLLTLAHCVLEDPEDEDDWQDLWEAGQFPPDRISAYLESWKDRFDLFHPETPFLQVGGFQLLDKKGEAVPGSPVSLLAQELASGNNATLFDHSQDGEPTPREPGWCARKLLATQAWGLFGGKGPTSNLGPHGYSFTAPLVGTVQVYLVRPTLFETLLANLLTRDHRHFQEGELGRPSWEGPGPRTASSDPEVPGGYLAAMTMPTRFLRLIPEQVDGELRVRWMYTAPGRKLDRTVYDEPFSLRRVHREKELIYPISLNPERDLWREGGALFGWREHQVESRAGQDLRPLNLRQACLLREQLARNGTLRVSLFGLANEKAKPLSWTRSDLPCPVCLLADEEKVDLLIETLGDLEAGGTLLWRSFRNLAHDALATEQKAPDPNDEKRIQKKMFRNSGFWIRVGEGLETFLEDLENDGEKARSRWIEAMKQIARESFREAISAVPGSEWRRLRAHARVERRFLGALKKIGTKEEAA